MALEALNKFSTLLSLAMTPSALIGCVGVVYLWWAGALSAYHEIHKKELHWFILGVVLGFMGSFFDNSYWAITWTAHYFGHASTEFWFENGVYSNIIFRQGCTIAAAFCHIRAAVESHSIHFRVLVALSWLSGISVMLILSSGVVWK